MTGSLRAGLEHGLAALGLNLASDQIAMLLDYLALIQKWNRVHNLTAVKDPASMLTHHLLDSLAVIHPLRRYLDHRPGGSSRRPAILDVGTGAGLPGAVIAICCPDMQVSCVDTVAKKIGFVRQVAAELELDNLQGVHARVETMAGPFDVVSSRAFASLSDFTTWSRQALAEGGVWMAMKGRRPQAEMDALPASVEVFHVEPLEVPGLGAERCLVWMRPSAADPVA